MRDAVRRLAATGLAAGLIAGLTVGSPGPPLSAQDRDALVSRGRQLFTDRGCLGCHTVGAVGTPIAPDLAGAVTRYREPDLARWLQDPSAQRPTRHMPDIGLSADEARAVAAYLASLR